MEELSSNTSTALPWRWTAPEVKERHNSGLVTVASDVYSFGGLIYEVLQLGEQPFKRQTSPVNQTQSLAGVVRENSFDLMNLTLLVSFVNDDQSEDRPLERQRQQ